MNAITLELLVGMYFQESPASWKDSSSQYEGVKWLVDSAMLRRRPNKSVESSGAGTLIIQDYELTQKGRIHVEALLAAPLPTQKWESPIPRG